MFNRKYSPSIKANNQLKDKVVAEINAFVYRLERGRYTSESDQESILRIIEDLKSDVEILSNTVGTGEENIGTLADGILELLKDLKKSSEQDTLHRIQEVADDLDFNVNLWSIFAFVAVAWLEAVSINIAPRNDFKCLGADCVVCYLVDGCCDTILSKK